MLYRAKLALVSHAAFSVYSMAENLNLIRATHFTAVLAGEVQSSDRHVVIVA